MKRFIILLTMLSVIPDATAQVRPQPGSGDPRIQTIDYRRDQVVLIEASPGYQVTIALAPDEQVQSVSVGDSAAWQVSANRAGNLLFVKPAQAGADTNMTVVTNARFYAFDLTSASSASGAPYRVRFRYEPSSASPDANAAIAGLATVGRYKVSGARSLRPTIMEDDGAKTYIGWPDDVALPAVFIIDERGRELLANGNMRDGNYVIDSVNARYLFRIDRQSARATRYLPKPAKP